MPKIALLFDRSYIETQHCYMEPAIQFANNGFQVDFYMVNNPYNTQPFFQNNNIRILPFPESAFQKMEYWSKIIYSSHHKYSAIIGTPVAGAWISYRTARLQKIPFYYFADELLSHMLSIYPEAQRRTLEKRNYIANKKAVATIALGEERYQVQKEQNRIDYPHEHIVLPNAPSGNAVRIRSNYFRDIFNIDDRKPLILFAGTLNWTLAKKIYEETKTYGERDYHLVFQTRTTGLMGENDHPFIKISTNPVPSAMLNYAFSSADIGLALYDKNSVHETNNGFTGGKIGSYLKNELPLLIGSAENLKAFAEQGVGTYWDGETDFDKVAADAIRDRDAHRRNIPEFFKHSLQYEVHFAKLLEHVKKSIK